MAILRYCYIAFLIIKEIIKWILKIFMFPFFFYWCLYLVLLISSSISCMFLSPFGTMSVFNMQKRKAFSKRISNSIIEGLFDTLSIIFMVGILLVIFHYASPEYYKKIVALLPEKVWMAMYQLALSVIFVYYIATNYKEYELDVSYSDLKSSEDGIEDDFSEYLEKEERWSPFDDSKD